MERLHWIPEVPDPAEERQCGCFCLREPHTDHTPALPAGDPADSPRTWHWAPGYSRLPLHGEDACRDAPPDQNSIRPKSMEPVPEKMGVFHSPEMDYAGARKLAAYHTTVEKLPTRFPEEDVSPEEIQVVNSLA